jgi:hypothetical protein
LLFVSDFTIDNTGYAFPNNFETFNEVALFWSLISTDLTVNPTAPLSATISVFTTNSCLPASNVSFKLAKVITQDVALTCSVTLPSILFPSNSA